MAAISLHGADRARCAPGLWQLGGLAQVLSQYPQGAIKLYVLINAGHGTGAGTAPLFVAASQPSFDGVFLYAVEGRPKVIGSVFAATCFQQLACSNRSRAVFRV